MIDQIENSLNSETTALLDISKALAAAINSDPPLIRGTLVLSLPPTAYTQQFVQRICRHFGNKPYENMRIDQIAFLQHKSDLEAALGKKAASKIKSLPALRFDITVGSLLADSYASHHWKGKALEKPNPELGQFVQLTERVEETHEITTMRAGDFPVSNEAENLKIIEEMAPGLLQNIPAFRLQFITWRDTRLAGSEDQSHAGRYFDANGIEFDPFEVKPENPNEPPKHFGPTKDPDALASSILNEQPKRKRSRPRKYPKSREG